VKKRVKKFRINNRNGDEESYSDEVSGSDSDCYTEEMVMEEYQTNEKGDPN